MRAELDTSHETMRKKIRNGTTAKIPNLLVIGEREQEDSTVTLRRYGVKEQETLSVAAFEQRILEAIRKRSRDL